MPAAGCAQLALPPDDVPLRAPDGYFPGAAWRTATPEAQGIDSEALIALFDTVASERLPIHSLHIARYGHLVLDAYFHPFARGERHDVASATKFVTATLVGLALERGALAGLDEWNGQQVVPRRWIAVATRRQADTPSGEGYGFGWWVSRDIPGMYQAAGRGGQRLIVWPAKDIAIVISGGG